MSFSCKIALCFYFHCTQLATGLGIGDEIFLGLK